MRGGDLGIWVTGQKKWVILGNWVILCYSFTVLPWEFFGGGFLRPLRFLNGQKKWGISVVQPGFVGQFNLAA